MVFVGANKEFNLLIGGSTPKSRSHASVRHRLEDNADDRLCTALLTILVAIA